jgi:hypothetical protein
MDESGYRELLASRHLSPEAVERSVAAVRRFEESIRRYRPHADLERATAGDILRFLEDLTERAENEEQCGEETYAVARYMLFANNHEAQRAILEAIDGIDVPGRLSRRLAEVAGQETGDEVFAGLDIPNVATGPEQKVAFMRELMARLSGRVDDATAKSVLQARLHYAPDEAFAEARERYLAAPDIDFFLADEHRRYIDFLAGFRDTGALYFTQPITDAVLDYVRETPTCVPGGVREGDVVHVTKIPYDTDAWLRETDPVRKRYLRCHCMWARASILDPDATVSARFCECSAGFEKQYWDVVLGQPVGVDVVKSVLAGDDVCEFAIYLPDTVPTESSGGI